jgi:hypothetical protein
MSKRAFYITVEKYKDAVALADFMDESKAPKNIISDQTWHLAICHHMRRNINICLIK